MLKTSLWLADVLPAIGINNSKVIRSGGRNNRKSAKSDFSKPMYRVEEPNFLTYNTKRAFTQLRQAFTETPILQYFDPERYI